jgi:hypothetical protein
MFKGLVYEMKFVARLLREGYEEGMDRFYNVSKLDEHYPNLLLPFWKLSHTKILYGDILEFYEDIIEPSRKPKRDRNPILVENINEVKKQDLNYRWQWMVMYTINGDIVTKDDKQEEYNFWVRYLKESFALAAEIVPTDKFSRFIQARAAATTPAAGSQAPAAANPPAGVVVPASGTGKDDEEIEEDIETTPNTPAQSVSGTPADQSEDTPPPSPKEGQKNGPAGGYDKTKQRTVKEGDDADEARKNRMRKQVEQKVEQNKEEREKKNQEKRDVRPSIAPANRTGQNEHLSFDDIAERLDRLQDW